MCSAEIAFKRRNGKKCVFGGTHLCMDLFMRKEIQFCLQVGNFVRTSAAKRYFVFFLFTLSYLFTMKRWVFCSEQELDVENYQSRCLNFTTVSFQLLFTALEPFNVIVPTELEVLKRALLSFKVKLVLE